MSRSKPLAPRSCVRRPSSLASPGMTILRNGRPARGPIAATLRTDAAWHASSACWAPPRSCLPRAARDDPASSSPATRSPPSTHAAAPLSEEAGPESAGVRPPPSRARHRARRHESGHSDINARDTIRSRVTIHYPFHPHHGLDLEVVPGSLRARVCVTVVDLAANHLKIPTWMVLPEAARHCLCAEATIAMPSLLELEELLRPLLEQTRQER